MQLLPAFSLSMQECEALGLSLPAFPQLEEVAADLTATQASWGGYRDFLAERDALAHKDWLSMRDQVRPALPFMAFCCLLCIAVHKLGLLTLYGRRSPH